MSKIVVPPVPLRSTLTDGSGLATRPWVAWFQGLVQYFGYQLVQSAGGAALPQEQTLNFLAPLTATDNPDNGSTDVGITLPATPKVQYGVSDAAAPLGGNAASVAVEFPVPFAAPPVVVCNPDHFPRSSGDPFGCYPTNITPTGFTANFWCAVPTGGGGSTIDSAVHANWIAIGAA